jgi:putative ABC transport system permease protein
VLHNGPAREPLEEVYLPASQSGEFTSSVAIRLRNDPRRSVKTIVQTVGTMDRDVVVLRIRTMDDVIANAVSQPRLAGLLTAVFAALSLVLAMTALYGVMAWAVARRRPEIGVRMALGANPSAILRLIVGQGMRLVVVGIAVGLCSAFLIAPLLARFLYGVQARDPSVFMLAALFVACVAAAANYIPASRAAAVDATISLRSM